MASASDHRAHAALQPADCLILLPQRLPPALETSIGPAHSPAECTQSDAFLQPSLRARNGRANSNSFMDDNRSGKGYFGLENGGISVFALGSFSCYLDPKLLIILSFLPSAGLAAGQFTVYKKSRSTALSADPAKNLILFSYLESQGAHANLP